MYNTKPGEKSSGFGILETYFTSFNKSGITNHHEIIYNRGLQ
ncbi:hypothetical protein BH23BAC3_BH23BAC3_19560 [soil metagenome]